MRGISFVFIFSFLFVSCQPLQIEYLPTRAVSKSETKTSPATEKSITTALPAKTVRASETGVAATVTVGVTFTPIPAKPSQTATPVQLTVTSTSSDQVTVQTTTPNECDPAENVCILDGHFVFSRPISAYDHDSVDYTYRYGTTQSYTREPHHGVEFPNQQGTPVYAAAEGTVVFAGSDKDTILAIMPAFYGNVVVIEHHFPSLKFPYYSLYAHLFSVSVTVGQTVNSGDQIGEVGATGTAIGSHLHFEVREIFNNYSSNRNPELWLEPLPGCGVLAGRIQDSHGNLLQGNINVQRITEGVLDPNSVTTLETYVVNELQPVKSDGHLRENFSAGDIPAGTYRLTIHQGGGLKETIVRIEEGRLTFVRFVLK